MQVAPGTLCVHNVNCNVPLYSTVYVCEIGAEEVKANSGLTLN